MLMHVSQSLARVDWTLLKLTVTHLPACRGEGAGGKLGQGHAVDSLTPQAVHTLWGRPVAHVAAGGESACSGRFARL